MDRKVFTIMDIKYHAFFSLQTIFKGHLWCLKEKFKTDLDVVIYLIRELYAVFGLDPNYLRYTNRNGNTLVFFSDECLVEFNVEKNYLEML